MILLLFSLFTIAYTATQCPCTFSINASSAVTANVYPVIECDQICGPPALAYQYYSFEEPLGPCNCFSNDVSLIGNYYENASSTVNLYYQNGGTISICDPCFPSPTPSPSPSTTVSPSGMCYVVYNLLYGKVYTDGYYTVVHGINASHAYSPNSIMLGINPSCTESPGICTCAYTGGSTFSCPYTRSATLRYQYGATTTMSFVNESPSCRYTFNMFINFNSVSPTPSPSPSFTPAGSPTVSKTGSVSLSPSVSPSRTSSQSVSPTISDSVLPLINPFVVAKSKTPSGLASPITTTSNKDSVTGIVVGSISIVGAIGIAAAQLLQTRKTTTEKEEPERRLSTIEETKDTEDEDEEIIVAATGVTTLHNDKNDDDEEPKQKTLIQVDDEDVDAVMAFLRQRMKSGTIICR